jgi:hypothetical protein
MFEFDPFYLMLWVFLGFFVPGAILSLALLKKKELPLFDKAAVGFGLGLFFPALFAFILFLLGIGFSYEVAVLCVALFYLAAIALFIKEKAWEGLSIPADYNALLPSAALALVMLLAFWIRVGSYGPVFMELDPYYYIQHTALILSDGGAPLQEDYAWYVGDGHRPSWYLDKVSDPDYPVSHRSAPAKAYLEAITYSLYNGSTEFDRYMLSAVAGMLPPVFAALSVFFLYLLISSEYRRTFGIAAAGVAAFLPMFVLKLMAGESEVQPYAFFGIALFLGLYALAVKRKDVLFAVLAGLAFLATSLGSSSAVVLAATLLLFIPLQALLLFFMKEDLWENVKVNGIVILIGPIFAGILATLFKGEFILSGIISGYSAMVLIAYIFSLAFLVLQSLAKVSSFRLPIPEEKLPKFSMDDLGKMAVPVAAILVLGILLVAFTPLGDPIFSIANSTLGKAEFTRPLDKTVAEQGLAGTSFESSLGFIGMDFTKLPSIDQLMQGFSEKNIVVAFFDLVVGLLQQIFAFAALFLTALSNLAVSALVGALNAIFGTSLEYNDKNNSMLMVVIFAMFVSVFHSIYLKFKTGEQRLALLFAAFILPISIIGLLKAKYTIYLGFAVAAGLGVSLGELSQFLENLAGKLMDEEKRKAYSSYLMLGLTLASFFFVYFEWNSMGNDLFFNSFQPRFQDSPEALQPKMQKLCTLTGYQPACKAAEDPVGFASSGTASQFDSVLCRYSLFSDPAKPTSSEQLSASLRCNLMAPYWIEFTEWQFEKSPEDARFTSWWDYGHWTNYFGQRDTVLSNIHKFDEMILEVAYSFIHGTPEELKGMMQRYGSEYVFFDREIIMNSDGSFGGKFHALNYLSCVRNNETSVAYSPGQSACEARHRWEQLALPATQQPCTISTVSGKSGTVLYDTTTGQPKYCLGQTALATGETIYAPYRLGETYENGDLKLQKAFLKQIGASEDGTQFFDVYYTKDTVWLENGELKSGWEDRTTSFYDSPLYQAFVLGSLEGFTQAYKTSDGSVKLYKISG